MGNPKFLLRTTVVSNSQWLKYERKRTSRFSKYSFLKMSQVIEEEPGRKLVNGSPAHNMPKVEDAREKSSLNS